MDIDAKCERVFETNKPDLMFISDLFFFHFLTMSDK